MMNDKVSAKTNSYFSGFDKSEGITKLEKRRNDNSDLKRKLRLEQKVVVRDISFSVQTLLEPPFVMWCDITHVCYKCQKIEYLYEPPISPYCSYSLLFFLYMCGDEVNIIFNLVSLTCSHPQPQASTHNMKPLFSLLLYIYSVCDIKCKLLSTLRQDSEIHCHKSSAATGHRIRSCFRITDFSKVMSVVTDARKVYNIKEVELMQVICTENKSNPPIFRVKIKSPNGHKRNWKKKSVQSSPVSLVHAPQSTTK